MPGYGALHWQPACPPARTRGPRQRSAAAESINNGARAAAADERHFAKMKIDGSIIRDDCVSVPPAPRRAVLRDLSAPAGRRRAASGWRAYCTAGNLGALVVHLKPHRLQWDRPHGHTKSNRENCAHRTARRACDALRSAATPMNYLFCT